MVASPPFQAIEERHLAGSIDISLAPLSTSPPPLRIDPFLEPNISSMFSYHTPSIQFFSTLATRLEKKEKRIRDEFSSSASRISTYRIYASGT